MLEDIRIAERMKFYLVPYYPKFIKSLLLPDFPASQVSVVKHIGVLMQMH